MTSLTLNGLRLTLHLPIQSFSDIGPRCAVLMMSGAGGGQSGPGGIYPELGERITKLPNSNIMAVSMDYQYPAYMKESVVDATETLKMLKEKYQIEEAILLGWSFGGGVVVSAAGQINSTRPSKSINRSPSPPSAFSPSSPPSSSLSQPYPHIRGMITVGTQTAGTTAITSLHKSNTSLLLFHGGEDTCLSNACSIQLYRQFAGTDKELIIYEGDNHGCTLHKPQMMEKIMDWVITKFKDINNKSSK